jgi:hypothetical protein
MTLKRVLRNQADQWRALGASPVEAIAALAAYQRTLLQRLVIKFAAFLIFLSGGTYLSASLLTDQAAIAAVIVAILGFASPLFVDLFRTWRELDYLKLILLLIRGEDDEKIKAIIDKLLEKL